MMRIILMATPAFALPLLHALYKHEEHELCAVYTQAPRKAGRGQKERQSPIHEAAESYGIPVYTPGSLKEESVLEELQALQADVIIVMAYGLLLPTAILGSPPYGCINIHPSPLPRFRGASPMQYTIMAGDTHTALDVIQMDEGLDTGDILARKEMGLAEDITLAELHDVMASAAVGMTMLVLDGLRKGTIEASKQSSEGVCYAHKITKEMRRIDWQEEAQLIERKLRGLMGLYCYIEEERVLIKEAQRVARTGDPGYVYDDGVIACGKDALQCLVLQRAGKKSLAYAEFCKGFRWPVGTKVN